MKLIVFLELVYVSLQLETIPQNETTTEVVLSIKQKCAKSSNLEDYYEFTSIANSRVSSLLGGNLAYSNYLSCYWKHNDLQKENGEINFIELERVLSYVVKEAIDVTDVPLSNTLLITTKIMEKCRNIKGQTHGQKAAKMRNCMYGKLLYQRNLNQNRIELDDFEDIAYLEIVEEECVNELKLNGLRIEDINRHYEVPENNTDFSNFLGCYWKKINMMDNEGEFNYTALVSKLNEVVEFELLSRSRAVYLNDVLTKSIVDGCREIKDNDHGILIVKVIDYIVNRLPYFKKAL